MNHVLLSIAFLAVAVAASAETEPLQALAAPDKDRIAAGEEVTLTVGAVGGEEPYVYAWFDRMNNQVGTSDILTVAPTMSCDYICRVTSADNQTATAVAPVYVTSPFAPATAADNWIDPSTHVLLPNAADALGDGTAAPLFSGSFAFNGLFTPDYGGYWNGYAFSNDPSNVYEGLQDQYRSAPGGGFDSPDFIVAYPAGYNVDYTIDVASDPAGAEFTGMYITNSAYSYTAMLNGDAYSKKFVEGDWFKLTVIATDAEGKEKSVDYYLADMRAENEFDRYIVNWWEWLDLSSLGKVVKLTFKFDGSDRSDWGVNTPQYFCIDNLGGTHAVASKSENVAWGEKLDLARLFEHADNGASEVYTITAVGEVPALTLDGWMVTIDDTSTGELKFKARATMTAAGHTEYLDLDITRLAKSDALETVGISDDTFEPVYFDLQGRRISRLETGQMVVRVCGAKAEKIIVR